MKNKILKYGIIAGTALILLTAIFLIVFFNRNVVIPEVTGKSISEATKLLNDAGLKFKTKSEYSDNILKNHVVSQEEKSGTKTKYGTEITLIVSKGKVQVTLPDLKDCTVAEAETTLEKLGFDVNIKEEFSNTITKGNIMAQSVLAGKKADKGSKITITISKGPDLVIVPNIQGMTLEKAEQILKDTGLRLEAEIQCSNNIKEGCIISQDVAGKSQIERNSVIKAKISAGVANTVGTTPSNANNFGHITTQGDWIYFSGRDETIYRMRKDKSETQRICNASAVSLNVIGEWLYFADGSSKGGIYKIKIDGTQKTKISNVTSYKVYVEGEWVYYTSEYWGGKIYKMKCDGTSVTKITNENCNEYIVNGQNIYYINSSDSLVYKCNIDGKGKTILCVGFDGEHLALADGKLVTVKDSYVKSVNLDGSGLISFKTNNAQYSFFNGCDGWIYYLEHNFKNDGTVVSYFSRMKPDGSQETKIYKYDFLNHANTYINVADNWIYFQNEHNGDNLYRVNIDGTKVEKM